MTKIQLKNKKVLNQVRGKDDGKDDGDSFFSSARFISMQGLGSATKANERSADFDVFLSLAIICRPNVNRNDSWVDMAILLTLDARPACLLSLSKDRGVTEDPTATRRLRGS